MALQSRTFVFESDGTLKYLPKRVSYGLYAQTERLPQYAGQTIRTAEALVDFEDRKPVRLLDASGHLLTFNDQGELVRDWEGFWGEMPAVDPRQREAKVVDLRPKIERQQWEKRNRWDMTGDHMDAIVAALWPTEGETLSVASIKGTAPKPPPMTIDAREALREIQGAISKIAFALEGLSEPAHKGLAFEARRIGGLEPAEAAVWSAVASLSDKQREIRSRHRKGTGVWYAAIDVFSWNEARTSGQVIDTVFEECRGKSEAIKTAQRLLAENAHKFGENTSVEARVCCDLEWVSRTTDD